MDYALTYVVRSMIMQGTKGMAMTFHHLTPSFTGMQQMRTACASSTRKSSVGTSSPYSAKAFFTSMMFSSRVKVYVRVCILLRCLSFSMKD